MKTLLFALFCFPAFAASGLMAIDLVLKPDEKMKTVAENMNAKLVNSDDVAGFAFDDSHFPHVTILPLVIKKTDLEKVLAIVKAEGQMDITLKSQTIEVGRIEGLPDEKLVSLNFEKKPELKKLQEKLLRKLKPYMQDDAPKDAFFDEDKIQPQFMNYVENFTEQHTGDNYTPHLTLGVEPKGFIHVTPPKEEFHFSGIGVYQMGEYGTARKELR